MKILITPLNWGLGHATRCLPLAAALCARPGVTVHWASDGRALALLRAELPADTPLHALPGYGMRYRTRSGVLNLLLGAPRMLWAIRQERRRVAKLHRAHRFDLIISDNRFGCRVPGVRSLVLTHQLHLPVAGPAGWVANRVNRAWLLRFDGVVVPDRPDVPRLAGAMSAPWAGVDVRYLGPLSRFGAGPAGELVEQPGACVVGGGEAPIDLLVVLSGLEPQRSRLEAAVLAALPALRLPRVVLVRGLPGGGAPPLPHPTAPGLEVIAFAPTARLRDLYTGARAILSRPGYTTLMDLAALGRTALYVPTPGQPEQQVLAQAAQVQGYGVAQPQDRLDLARGLAALGRLAPLSVARDGGLLQRWVASLRSRASSASVHRV